ncbi:MAG TPA: hypothetical protein VK611_12715 [Acidimicrobiales bacterium]|nr:hypothetical protein [Acidimicrobiales bacterium]
MRDADRPTIDLLVSSGVRLELWTLPAELIEPRPIGAPLSHDDLLDFHELLEGKGWFNDLLAAHKRGR